MFSYSVVPRLPPIHTGRYSVIAIKVSLSKYLSRYRYFYGKVSISVSTILFKAGIDIEYRRYFWKISITTLANRYFLLLLWMLEGNCINTSSGRKLHSHCTKYGGSTFSCFMYYNIVCLHCECYLLCFCSCVFVLLKQSLDDPVCQLTMSTIPVWLSTLR